MKKKLTSKEALEIALNEYGIEITLATLLNWCKKLGLGIQIGDQGKWHIDEDKLRNYLNGTYKGSDDQGDRPDQASSGKTQ